MDEIEEWDVIGGPYEPPIFNQLQVGIGFKTMVDFRLVLNDTIIKRRNEVEKVESNKRTYVF